MNLRAKIQEIIDKEPTSEQAAIKICILLEDKFGLNSYGWCDDDEVGHVNINREMQEPEKTKTPDRSLKTLFTTEEKAILGKGIPDVTDHGVGKQPKLLKTLFTAEEKTDINKKEKGGDEPEIEH